MNNKKLFLLILSIIILVLTAVACDTADTDAPDEYEYNPADDHTPGDDNGGHGHSHDAWIDFEAALSAFPPDTVMVRAGDFTLTWAELFVFLHRTTSTLMHTTLGSHFDWSEDFEPGSSLAEVVLEFSTEEAISFLSFEYGAKAIDLQLTDEELKTFDDDLEYIIEMYEGRDALEASLRELSGFYDFDTFLKLFKTEFMIGLIISRLYGEEASSFPDDKVAEFAQEHNFLMAMHILRLKSEDEGADPLSEAEEILTQLTAQLGSDNFNEYFKTLMDEKSEDYGGLMSYPTGYLFVFEDMVPEFSFATTSLEIGEISGVVETTYGYHIILRLPIDYDIVPSGLSREGIMRTLRQVAALYDFENTQEEWRNALNVEFSPEYNTLDLEVLFKWHDEDCDH